MVAAGAAGAGAGVAAVAGFAALAGGVCASSLAKGGMLGSSGTSGGGRFGSVEAADAAGAEASEAACANAPVDMLVRARRLTPPTNATTLLLITLDPPSRPRDALLVRRAHARGLLGDEAGPVAMVPQGPRTTKSPPEGARGTRPHVRGAAEEGRLACRAASRNRAAPRPAWRAGAWAIRCDRCNRAAAAGASCSRWRAPWRNRRRGP